MIDSTLYRASNPAPIPLRKVDIDMCECHVLTELLRDEYYHAKIFLVEVNQLLPPPISFKEMCWSEGVGVGVGGPTAAPTSGAPAAGESLVGASHSRRHANRLNFNMRNSQSADVWGCSMQAAEDILRPHGYGLLQYDCTRLRAAALARRRQPLR
jgi:hypothetical protein